VPPAAVETLLHQALAGASGAPGLAPVHAAAWHGWQPQAAPAIAPPGHELPGADEPTAPIPAAEPGPAAPTTAFALAPVPGQSVEPGAAALRSGPVAGGPSTGTQVDGSDALERAGPDASPGSVPSSTLASAAFYSLSLLAVAAALAVACAQTLLGRVRLLPELARPPAFVSLLERPG
jgi:hypothetical protein